MDIETADPRDASGLNDLGLTLAAQGRFDDAIERYRKATALWGTTGSPDRKFALYNWAEALRQKKLYEESARKYGEAIVVDPKFAPACNGLGLALAGQERFDAAIKQYRKAAALWETTGSPDRKLALCNWAEALGSKKLYDDAARKYGEAIVVDPKFAPACNGLGLALAGQKRFDAAIKQYRKAAALWETTGSPDRKLALCNWAEALDSKNLYEKAAKKYGEAIAVDPNYALAYNGLGFALVGQERFDEAIEQCRKAAALWEFERVSRPEVCGLRYWAKALRLKKLYEESAKKCGEAIAVDVNFALAYNDLGLALAGQERFDDAIEQYRKAVALLESTGSPDRKFALLYWAEALGSKKLYEESAKKCGEAIDVDAKFAHAYCGLGLALADQERFDEAIEQYRKAVAQWESTGSPDRKFALLNWADALRLKKLYEESANKYGEAIAVDPNYADAHHDLGLALAGQERFDEAIEQYRTAAALWESTGSPDRKFALLNWARALGLKKLYEEAAKKCGETIAVDPNFAPAYNYRGLALASQERFDEADRAISHGRRAVGERQIR